MSLKVNKFLAVIVLSSGIGLLSGSQALAVAPSVAFVPVGTVKVLQLESLTADPQKAKKLEALKKHFPKLSNLEDVVAIKFTKAEGKGLFNLEALGKDNKVIAKKEAVNCGCFCLGQCK